MPINPLSLPTLLDWGPWAPLVVYATYLLRYFLVRKPVQTGLYNNLVADLLDSVGREAALKKIGAPNRWHAFYRNSLDGLLRFFDRWFGDGREGWLSPRALHVCYLLAFGYEAGIHDGVIDIPPHHRKPTKRESLGIADGVVFSARCSGVGAG
uniref:Uncharacterized protein n=1 Tax=Candidatus Kentrum sp. FW TaxID=2126338 RepID=A0A450T1E9_9GAMM|nr:MAG: hypothetical protein BECKFW1821A_GA0114235_110010 [Candidatus Kentron sp. FW]